MSILDAEIILTKRRACKRVTGILEIAGGLLPARARHFEHSSSVID